MTLLRMIEVNPAASAEQYLHMATYLPLRHLWHIPAFMGMTFQLQQQLRATAGLVRYGVRAQPFSKRFWTYSVWTDRPSANAFVKAEPHATAMKRFPEWAGEGAAFADWTSPEPTLNWDQARERLSKPTFYYKAPRK